MKNNNTNTPNYKNNYNSYQLCLPLNLEYVLDENDEVFSFLEAIGAYRLFLYIRYKMINPMIVVIMDNFAYLTWYVILITLCPFLTGIE